MQRELSSKQTDSSALSEVNSRFDRISENGAWSSATSSPSRWTDRTKSSVQERGAGHDLGDGEVLAAGRFFHEYVLLGRQYDYWLLFGLFFEAYELVPGRDRVPIGEAILLVPAHKRLRVLLVLALFRWGCGHRPAGFDLEFVKVLYVDVRNSAVWNLLDR